MAEIIALGGYCKTLVNIVPQQLSSFKEIVNIGRLNGYSNQLEKDTILSKALFGPVLITSGEQLILYWEGRQQNIPGGSSLNDYLNSKGYDLLTKAHPSLLVGSMGILTEEKLLEIGIPPYVDVVLPTDKSSLILNEKHNLCFLSTIRHRNHRFLGMADIDGDWDHNYCFLVHKNPK